MEEVKCIENGGKLTLIKQQHRKTINQGKKGNGPPSRNISIIKQHALTEKDNKSIASGEVDVVLELKMAAFNRTKAAISAYK